MKIQHKVTILFAAFVVVFLLVFTGYQYIRYTESKIYREAKLKSDTQLIKNVIDFRSEKYFQATKDNGAWDELVDFIGQPDSVWASENLRTILESFEMSSLAVYGPDGTQLYEVTDSSSIAGRLRPDKVLSFFKGKKEIHAFYFEEGNLYEMFGATIVPVLDSKRLGQAKGYLVSTKMWDSSYINSLQSSLGFNLIIREGRSENDTIFSVSDTIYAPLPAAGGGIVGRIACYPHQRIQNQLRDLQKDLMAGLAVLILFFVVISWLTSRWISNPVNKITRSLSDSKDESIRELEGRRDEFGQIAVLIRDYRVQSESLIREMENRHKSDIELKAAQDFSRLIYEVIPSAIYTVDLNRVITSWNKKAEMITGYEASEMIGESCDKFALTPCDEICGLFDPNTLKPVSGRECTVRHKSGKVIAVIKNIDVLRDSEGKIIGGVESFEDISERKRIEIELRESELRYSTLVKKMPNIIVIHKGGKFLYANEACKPVLGYEPEELYKHDLMHFLTPESVERVMHFMKLRADGHSIPDYDIQAVCADGTIKDFIIKTELITFDQSDAVMAILIDITAQKKYEKELIEREIKLNTITGAAQDGIVMLDNRGKVSFWNKAAAGIFGYSEEEVMGKNFHLMIAPPRYHKAHFAAFDQFRKTGKGNAVGETLELMALRKDGTEFDVELSLSGIELHGEWVSIGIIRDISERKRDEQALFTAKEEAEKANQAKSEFLAMMSHEIRTPMNAVIGMTELTLTTRLTDTQKDYLESVKVSAYTLLDTINDILDFSKIEAGKLELEMHDFNLREMIERTVEVIKVKAFTKNIEVLLEIDPRLPAVFTADALRIRQVLTNLISNAIKFTEKGEICISAHILGDSRVGENASVEFSVRDTGIGITPEQLDKVFSSFVQADNSTTRKYGGSGLGLSISKKLTEIMKGKISAESKPGQGSTFKFVIPMMVAEEQELQLAPDLSHIKNVLVVDDNETNLRIMHDMLDYWGVKSDCISDPVTALEVIKASNRDQIHYDMMILDLHMPEMSGIALAERIRKEMVRDTQPLILMFSSIEKDYLKAVSKSAGIDRHLAKPVKMHDLYLLLAGMKQSQKIAKEDPVQKQSPNVRQFPDKTILIAEDNALNLKLMKALLATAAVNVLSAGTGAEAVQLFKDSCPDLVLMDVHMPVMDGLEATRIIRSMEAEDEHTPIIALTAIAMEGDRDRCIESGMDDYLSKPFKNVELFAMLEKYLTESSKEKPRNENTTMESNIDTVIFDRNSFMELIGHDMDLFEELLRHFTDLMPGLLDNLETSIAASDLKQINYFSHTIKGMSANIFALRISAMAKQIEINSQNTDKLQEMSEWTEVLKNEFLSFRELVKL
jgi:two-component system sensor histidine kinase/response regulator